MKKILFLPILFFILAACSQIKMESEGDLQNSSRNSGLANGSADVADNFADLSGPAQPELPYSNQKYAFALKKFPSDFKVEQLGNDAGIIFKKWVEPPPSKNIKDPSFAYEAEIYLMPFQNIEDYQNLSEFVGKKYAGYTFEFADYGKFSGYYVNEGVALDAVSHFYTMSADAETIYEAYLKVPSKYYDAQRNIFEDLVENMIFY